jgi:NAD(P)-dependent dehydrogenase (short-subunit alcohol dehydrogenase family)
MKPLSGKTAIITGGGQGIGLGISHLFLQAAASLVIVQRSPLSADLSNRPGVLWVEADLTKPDSYDQIANAAKAKFGSVDILVNNAGIMFEKSLDTMKLEDWQQMMAINLTAPVFLAKALLPMLRDSKGCIINIGSIEGIDANPEHIAYCATKGRAALDDKSNGSRSWQRQYPCQRDCTWLDSFRIERRLHQWTGKPRSSLGGTV